MQITREGERVKAQIWTMLAQPRPRAILTFGRAANRHISLEETD
jgi:hypothetical protein